MSCGMLIVDETLNTMSCDNVRSTAPTETDLFNLG